MAIEFNLTPSPTEILAAFEVSQAIIDDVVGAGIYIKITPYHLKFEDVDGHPLGSVMLKASAVKYALEGKLTTASIASVSLNITSTIKKILAVLGSTSDSAELIGEKPLLKEAVTVLPEENTPSIPPGIPEFWDNATKEGVSILKEAVAEVAAEADAMHDDYVEKAGDGEVTQTPPVPESVTEGKYMKKVDLINATALYQPVNGTSTGSTYWTVALAKDLAIAVRFKGKTVSIRAEGDIPAYKDKLETGGLDIKNTTYASVHLQADNPLLANRAVGACLMGMEIEFDTPMPSLMYLQKGAA